MTRATWHTTNDIGEEEPLMLVDGKQRLEAVRSFLRDELTVFGDCKRSDFTDHMRHYLSFRVHVNALKTRAEVLTWYLQINAGGVVHSDEEIERVKELLKEEESKASVG